MTQRLALAVSLLLAGSIPALAQTHTAQHQPGQPHDRSSHPAIDAQEHALMHGLVGNWMGTLTSPDGSSTKLSLAAANDRHGELTLKMASSRSTDVGTATDVVMDGQTLRWTQALSGQSCKASAVVTAKTAQTADMMKGTLACPEREVAFALKKTK